MPTRNPSNPFWELNTWGYLPEVHTLVNNRDEIETCVQLQGYNLVGIMETQWDGSHDWNIAMKEYRLLRISRLEKQEGFVVLCVTEQLEYMELCLRMYENNCEVSFLGAIRKLSGHGPN